jgi:hypothetical protein
VSSFAVFHFFLGLPLMPITFIARRLLSVLVIRAA